jgi:hypothetical protein
MVLMEQQEDIETTRISYGSMEEGLDNIQEDYESSGGHSDYYSREKTPSSVASQDAFSHQIPLIHIDKPQNKDDDEDLLSRFLGEETVQKMKMISSSNINPQPNCVENSITQRSYDKHAESSHSSNGGSTVPGLKTESTKNDARSSVAMDMQLFRRKLQEEAKLELEAFDKEFDSPSSLSFLETEKKSYRYSILNRMEELLNSPITARERVHTQSSHVRQSSEPTAMIWDQPQSPVSIRNTTKMGGHFTTSQSTQFHPRKRSEPTTHSFKLPSSQTYTELYKKEEQGRVRKSNTHYDTTVLKRRSSTSSQGGTLEKKKNKLRYSVESLNSDEPVIGSPVTGSPISSRNQDFDAPEQKSISKTNITKRNEESRPHYSKMDSLPNSYVSDRPKLAPKQSLPFSSAEVYPEISSQPPSSYMTTKSPIRPGDGDTCLQEVNINYSSSYRAHHGNPSKHHSRGLFGKKKPPVVNDDNTWL